MQPPDGGPIYVETNLARAVAEPFNAATAALFLALAAWIALRLRARPHPPLLRACVPVLAIGGVGGTLYHALRTQRLYLVMDFLPILLLLSVIAGWLWLRVLPRRWMLALALPPFLLLPRLAFASLPRPVAINAGYVGLAAMVLVPAAIAAARAGRRAALWLAAALALFAAAISCRYADSLRPPLLPMGTHWLWHLGGIFASACLVEFLLALQGPPRAAGR